ncbi:Werner helicase interacting protein 1 [Aspergillus hancockii]|nr:Werner helicase interacting protein 1 [Aspergillus hancockii]
MVECPICHKQVALSEETQHIDSGCRTFLRPFHSLKKLSEPGLGDENGSKATSTFEATKRRKHDTIHTSSTQAPGTPTAKSISYRHQSRIEKSQTLQQVAAHNAAKRQKSDTVPLAERVRPTCFDDIIGQKRLISQRGSLPTSSGRTGA